MDRLGRRMEAQREGLVAAAADVVSETTRLWRWAEELDSKIMIRT